LWRTAQQNRRRAARFQPSGERAADARSTDGRSETASLQAAKERETDIARALRHLPARERSIVSARFGLDATGRAKSLHEIAESIDLSTERVRQILLRSLGKLREHGQLDASWDQADKSAAS
jgi:RNA polymerase sigma factor (sigma-70 family)